MPASSYAGFWFVRQVADGGHEVVMTYQRMPIEHDDAFRAPEFEAGIPRDDPAFETKRSARPEAVSSKESSPTPSSGPAMEVLSG